MAILRQLLNQFETSPGPISLDALARRMGMERAVLEAMLAELVRMGRLVRMDSQAAAACSACGHANGCPFVLSVTGVYYALPERVAEPAHCSAERDQGFSKALLDPALHDLSYVNKREVS